MKVNKSKKGTELEVTVTLPPHEDKPQKITTSQVLLPLMNEYEILRVLDRDTLISDPDEERVGHWRFLLKSEPPKKEIAKSKKSKSSNNNKSKDK